MYTIYVNLLNYGVSVIVCTYNSQKYLDQTLNSLLSFPEIIQEVIIVDGQSNDNTRIIINKHKINEVFKVLFFSSPPLGVAHAMNLGATNANGKYLAFLNSDDFWNDSPELHFELTNILTSAEHDLYVFSCIYLQNGITKIRSVKLSKRKFFGLFLQNRIFHPSTVVKNDYFKKIGGFDLLYPTAFDYDFWLRASKTAGILTNPRPLATFRVHNESLSFKYRGKAIREIFNIRIKHSSNFVFYLLSLLLYFRDVLFYVMYEFRRLFKLK
jgi:glycosyltransferase involved in cell wall biosynthesis